MADIFVRTVVASFSASANTGDFVDITIPGLGATPKAIKIHSATTESLNATQQNTLLNFGVSDGVRQHVQTLKARDGTGSTYVQRAYGTTAILYREIPSTSTFPYAGLSAVGAGAGPIADGWRLQYVGSQTAPDDWQAVVTLYGGADYQGYANVAVAPSSGTSNITGAGFQGNALETFCVGANIGTSRSTDGFYLLANGVAIDDATDTQFCHFSNAQYQSSSSRVREVCRDDSVTGQLQSGSDSFTWRCSVSAWLADGFQVRLDAGSPGGDDFGFLYHQFGGDSQLALFDKPSPTDNTVDYVIDEPGFQIDALIVHVTNARVANTFQAGRSEGIAVYDSSGAITSSSVSGEDASATSNTARRTADNRLFSILDDTGAIYVDATTLVPNASGATIPAANINIAAGPSRRWVYFAIGISAVSETELDCDPITLGWSLENATVTVEETALDTSDLSLGWSLDLATLVQEEATLDTAGLTLQWALQETDVIAANVIPPENLLLGWSLADTTISTDIIVPDALLFGFGIQTVTLVQEEQPLTADPLTLNWSLQTVDVIGQNEVLPEPLTLGWALDAATIDIEEQSLTPAFIALTWQLSPVTVQQAETALGTEDLTLQWALGDASIVVPAVSPDALTLQWALDFAQVFEAMPEEAVQIVKIVRPESVDVKVYSSTRGVKK